MNASETQTAKLFEILVREHHHRLVAFAMSLGVERETARDLVQDSFLVAYTKMDQFDSTRDFGAWMRGIVRHKYLHWIAKRRETPIDPALIGEIDAFYAGWEDASYKEGIFEHLKRCVARLPEILHQVVHEFYFRSSSCYDVAQTVDAEVATVRKRLERAREQLEACLRQALAKVQP
jgi:RNA polymerase sigma-70 factor (ECF subfamily)